MLIEPKIVEMLADVCLNPVCREGSFKSADVYPLHCAYGHEDPVEGRF